MSAQRDAIARVTDVELDVDGQVVAIGNRAAPRGRVHPPTPAERVRALLQLGPLVRLPTRFATLDRSCRGGLPTPRLVVVGGAPGAGKTTLATYLGWSWAKAGIPVTMLAVDEGPDGVHLRVAQLEGLDVERIEARDADEIERLAAILEAAPLATLDALDAAGTVEGAAAHLATHDPAKPRVLIVDSIQTVEARGTDHAESPREKVDLVMRALRLARDTHGFLVVATCELARGAYRSRNVAETINDLAAFKESGRIEYAAQTCLVLRSVPDEEGLIDVTVPKNRAYRRDPFRLRLDHRTTALVEVDLPPASTPARRATRSPLDADAQAIVKVLLASPGVHGEAELRGKLRAGKIAISNERVRGAVTYLRDAGHLEDRPEKGRPRWYYVTTPTALEEGADDDDR